MSCPDWRAATAWRAGDGAAPAAWWQALEHLEGCASCRRRVAELDPTVLLAAAAAPAPAMEAAEVDALSSTVRSMVAAERLTAVRQRPDRRAVVAAAALIALLAAPLGLSRLAERTVVPAAPPEIATALPEPVAAPPVEEVQPAGARVYQIGTEELPVVLIFDENLDL